jgi:hypothetical protein
VPVSKENENLVGEYFISYERGIEVDEDGNPRRSPPPFIFSKPRGPFALKPKKPAPNPFTRYPPFTLEIYEQGLFQSDLVLPNIDLIIG